MEKKLKIEILKSITELFNIELSDIKLTVPPKKEMGDFAFNCGVLARDLKKNPIIIAEELIIKLREIKEVLEVSNEGAFINIKINNSIFSEKFKELYNSRNDKEFLELGEGETIFVDYIGPNVGKPLHIGHMCTPNQGQAMINIYKKLGYNVISDSHICDWGIIFGKLIKAYKLWGDDKKLEKNAVDYLLELYIKITKEVETVGESLEVEIRKEFKILSEGNLESIELWKKFTSESLVAMQILLTRLNVKSDYNIGESFYEGLGLPKLENYPDLTTDMHTIVKLLVDKNIATKNDDNSVGVVFPEESKIPSCILQKRDGTHGYLASDIASIKYRVDNWNPKKIVYFVDSRQQLHLHQAFEISRKAGFTGNTELFHAANGFISLKDGAMSTRKGRIVKLDALLDEAEERAAKIILEKRDDISGEELNNISKIIGIGAIKYGYLKKTRDTDVIFDWDEFMSFEGNSGPFIQYAYVRSIRILEKSDLDFESIEFGILDQSEEIELIKLLGNYKEVLEKATLKDTPHVLCKYAYDLTRSFNSLYNNVHILNEEDEIKKSMRLKLIKTFSYTLKDCFALLGIEMPNKM